MARINGAGINGAGMDGGAFSATARSQYAAMAALRWHMFINGLRSKLGAFELGARTVVYVIYAAMGLGLGAGMGVGAYLLTSSGRMGILSALFWVAAFLWQMIPLMLASFQEQFDLSILLRFPVSFQPYFVLYVVFGLADVSTILGALCCVGLWTGITLARPELFAWTALALALFAAFNILLVRAIFAWIDRWLSQRKTREIAGALFMVLLLSLQLLNPALQRRQHAGRVTAAERAESTRRMWAEYGPWLTAGYHAQQWMPPGLAARAVRQAGSEKRAGIGLAGPAGDVDAGRGGRA